MDNTMDNTPENTTELNLNEMEEISGGAGGSRKVLPAVAGFRVYKIVPGDNLTKIARRNKTTVKRLMEINPDITNRNFIRSGFYMYIPD